MADQEFEGRCVWVTGAAQGIGLAIARAFAAQGARVIGLDRAFSTTQAGPDFAQVPLDVADPDAVASVTRWLLEQGRAPQVLVNAAGVLRTGAFDVLADDDWRVCMDVNAAGAFHLMRALGPSFRAARGGAIVNIASNAAHVPRIGMAAYCASKAALVALSHCVALELAAFGVRCNVVSPGSTDTPMLRTMLGDDAGLQRTIDGLPAQYKLGIPLGKLARAQDIADAVLFLASGRAAQVTMQDLVIDGGATLAA